MQEHPIELELRAEVSATTKDGLLNRLHSLGILHSETRRLSVMLFGQVKNVNLDIRIRVTNGKCEVVSKAGNFGSHNRTEFSQDIAPDQLVGMVKLFSQFGFLTKVGERETTNFSLPNDITASLVSAGSISYLELEKMSTFQTEQENLTKLQSLASELVLTPIKSEDEFEELCQRLNDTVDWFFGYSEEDYTKLAAALKKYF